MERVLVVLLAIFFWAIGCYFLQIGHSSPVKATSAFLIGILILVAASRKAPNE